MTDDEKRAQAEAVRDEAERLYVHDPKTVRHPSWAEFNRFLTQVLELCRTVLPAEPTNPFLWSQDDADVPGGPPAPAPGDTVTVVDPNWNCRQVTLATDVTGPFYTDTVGPFFFDRYTNQWLVFTRFPIPAAHGERYKSLATAYPVPQETL